MERKEIPTIGIAGAGCGCGVTHFTLLLANYLAGMELETVAVLEWNQSHAFQEFLAICTGGTPKKGPVPLLGADYFPSSGVRDLEFCLQKGYGYILMDFGMLGEIPSPEFLQCRRKFFLGALNEWKIQDLIRQKERIVKERGSWTFLAAFGGKEARKELARRFGLSFEQIPYSPDAFFIERDMAVFLKRIWKERG